MVVYLSSIPYDPSELYHHGIRGQRWGVRRFQEEDGSYTNSGKTRHAKTEAKRVDRLEDSIQKNSKLLTLAKKNSIADATIGNIQRGKIAKLKARKELRDSAKDLKKQSEKLFKNRNKESFDKFAQAKKRFDEARANKTKVYKENKSLGKTLKNQEIKRNLKAGKSEKVANLKGAALGTVFGVGTKALVGAAAVGIGSQAVTNFLNSQEGQRALTMANIATNNLRLFF